MLHTRLVCFSSYSRSAAEHLFNDSRVIIRENEPTSIIAFTLGHKQYRDKIRNNRQTGRKNETFMPQDSLDTDRASTWDIVSLDEAVETDDPSKREGGTHYKYGQSLNYASRTELTTQTSSRGLLPSFAESFSPSGSRLCERHVNAKIALLRVSRDVYRLMLLVESQAVPF